MIPVRENSEVVIIYPDMIAFIGYNVKQKRLPAGWEILELTEHLNGKINKLNGEFPLLCYCV